MSHNCHMQDYCLSMIQYNNYRGIVCVLYYLQLNKQIKTIFYLRHIFYRIFFTLPMKKENSNMTEVPQFLWTKIHFKNH